MKLVNRVIKSTLSIFFAIFACSSNFAVAEPTSPPSSPSGGVPISRGEFESRFGKPLWTEDDFAKNYFSIYGIELTNFLAQPAQHAKEMANLSGAAPAAELSEASYHVVAPRIFVDSVPSNTLASLMGLKPGDEILEAYWETAPYGKGFKQTLNRGGNVLEWKPSPEDATAYRVELPLTALSLWKMNLSDVLHDDRSGLLKYTEDWFGLSGYYRSGPADFDADREQDIQKKFGKDWFTNFPPISTKPPSASERITRIKEIIQRLFQE